MGYIYLSYSRQNTETTNRLVSELQQRGYTFWIDTQDLKTGARWSQQVEAAIRDAEVFIVLLSPAAQNRTIQNEITLAHNASKPIIPVLLEQTTIPAVLANHQIVNAAGDWDAFIQRLVNAIDASAASLQIRQVERAAVPVEAPAATMPLAQPQRKGPNRLLIALGLLAIIAVIVVAMLALSRQSQSAPANVAALASATPTSSPTANPTDTRIPSTATQRPTATALAALPTATRAATQTRRPQLTETIGEDSTDTQGIADADLTATAIMGRITAEAEETEPDVQSTQVIANANRTATAIIRRVTDEAAQAFTQTAQAPNLTNMQMTATALIQQATDVARLRAADMTATAVIRRATTEAAAALTKTAEAPGLSNVQLTATALAGLFVGMTETVESGASPLPMTALPETGGGGDIRTEVALQVEGTVAAAVATENSVLSPAEAAQISGLSNNNIGLIFVTGIVAASALGVAITALVVILTGASVPRSRPRSAHAVHHHSGQPGQPQSVLPKMMLEDYQIFTSSSDKDKEWVRILVEDLEALGYAVWWYAKDAPGLPFGNEIRSAIYHTKVFMIVLSPDSMQSKHIEEEIRWAEIYDRPIIPVECRPTTIEERFYGLAKGADIDFTADIDYKEALEYLAQAIDHHLQQRLDQLNIEDSHDSD